MTDYPPNARRLLLEMVEQLITEDRKRTAASIAQDARMTPIDFNAAVNFLVEVGDVERGAFTHPSARLTFGQQGIDAENLWVTAEGQAMYLTLKRPQATQK